MKKRLFTAIFALLLCLTLSVTALAADKAPLLVDEADLLTSTEESSLLSTLEAISQKQKMDVVVVTVDDLNGESAMDYADDFYDYNGYAEDGILLLVSIGDSRWHITTTGYGITAVTDAGLSYLSDQFVGDLSSGDYYDAFKIYAEECDSLIDMARDGDPFDVEDLPKAPFKFLKNLLIALGIGLVAALITTGSMRSKLKTVRRQAAASDYVKAGSMKVTQSRDFFLYRQVNRREKAQSSGSGGSRTHTSSSGRTHGGGGGRF